MSKRYVILGNILIIGIGVLLLFTIEYFSPDNASKLSTTRSKGSLKCQGLAIRMYSEEYIEFTRKTDSQKLAEAEHCKSRSNFDPVSDPRIVVEDLNSHADKLTLVLIGSSNVISWKGVGSCHTKLYSGKSAFGTYNDMWFGSGPSASEQKITREEMLAVISTLQDNILQRCAMRSVSLQELKSQSPSLTFVFEGDRHNLEAAAIAIGYPTSNNNIIYYIAKLNNRPEAIKIMTRLKKDVKNSEDTSCAIGNVIYRVSNGACFGSD